jgi:uncharacterized RDD family membrane protein YckC
VEFSFPTAGPFSRALAAIIDGVVVLAVLVALGQLSAIFAIVSPELMALFQVLAGFVITVCYGIAMEWFNRGRTVGKIFMKLQVVDAAGLRLQFHQVLLRNVVRPVDMLPFYYMVGGLVSFFSPRFQRLGDMAAGTVVIRIEKVEIPQLEQLLAGKYNSLRDFPRLVARLRQRVGAQEARVALQALLRREQFLADERVRLYKELADHFRAVVPFPPEAVELVPDEQYLRNVVDVLFRTA